MGIPTLAVHNHTHHQPATGNIKAAFFINLALIVAEIIGGALTNSVAVFSNALHDIGDAISLGLAWVLEKISGRKGDHAYSYGYTRFSVLGAVINSVVLISGSLFILAEAVPRLFNPEFSHAPGMIILALAGIGANVAAALRLRSGRSLNEQMVGWHFIEDALGWIAVLIVSVVLFFAKIYILDPILSILITIYILFNVIKNFRQTAHVFLQRVPEEIEIKEFEAKITEIENVVSIHDTHIWSLDGLHHVLTAHIVVTETLPREAILRVKETAIRVAESLHVHHATIEIEYENETCRVK